MSRKSITITNASNNSFNADASRNILFMPVSANQDAFRSARVHAGVGCLPLAEKSLLNFAAFDIVVAFRGRKSMYCSSCGVAVAQSLSYCNYCGAKLNGAKGDNVSKSPEVKPELLVSAMVGLFILGLVAIAVLIGVMKVVAGFDLPIVLAVTIFSFSLMLVVEGIIISLLLRRKRGAEQAGDNVLLKGQETKELDAAQARVLPEPLSSVTEHTTRAFDPVYNERTSK
jgi:hypothetical protein